MTLVSERINGRSTHGLDRSRLGAKERLDDPNRKLTKQRDAGRPLFGGSPGDRASFQRFLAVRVARLFGIVGSLDGRQLRTHKVGKILATWHRF